MKPYARRNGGLAPGSQHSSKPSSRWLRPQRLGCLASLLLWLMNAHLPATNQKQIHRAPFSTPHNQNSMRVVRLSGSRISVSTPPEALIRFRARPSPLQRRNDADGSSIGPLFPPPPGGFGRPSFPGGSFGARASMAGPSLSETTIHTIGFRV